MISVTLNTLSHVLKGFPFGCNIIFNTVVTDTRNIIPGCLFVALKGDHFDGHDFVEQAREGGAGGILVDRKMHINLPQLVVKNTRLAFGELASWVRQQVPARVVALTGSSGKTSVKTMTASILSQCGNTLCTSGNLNNDIGVPMTLLRLTEEYKYAVIELGASNQGGLAWTAGLTCPEAALVNNFSESHLEKFGSLKGVAAEKGKIYTGLLSNGIAILNEDSNDWNNWRTMIGTRKIWRFSLKNLNSDFTALDIRTTLWNSKFTLRTPVGVINILLPLPGRHNLANALAASALSMSVGASLEAIKAGIFKIKSIPGRLFPIALAKNQLLLDDSYNANISSMTVAVQILSKMRGYRVIVVSDMAELGENSESYHIQIGNMIKSFNIDCVLSIGKLSKALSRESGVGKHFANKKSLIEYIKILLTKHPVITILVKGSRSAAMEEIAYALQEKKEC